MQQDVDQLWERYWASGRTDVGLRNELVEAHLWLADRNAKHWMTRLFVWFEFEELVCLAARPLIRAVETWDPARKASFDSHATNCIRNAYWIAAGRELRHRRRFLSASPSALELPTENLDLDRLSAKDHVAALIAKADLSSREAEFLRLRFEAGLAYQEIGQQHGLTKQRVHQIVGDALAKLCKARRLTADGLPIILR